VPFYEIVYEPGSHALVEYTDDVEAKTALQAHNAKATQGISATPSSQERADVTGVPGPTSWPAERVAKVYKFASHPAEYGVGNKVQASDLTEMINSMRDEDGLIDANEAAAAVRSSTSPHVNPETPHDSLYAMPHEDFEWDTINPETAGN
jgi:hypothetical protein